MLSRSVLGSGLLLAAVFAACENPRSDAAAVPFAGGVEAVLDAQCVRCHAGLAPAGGWRADSYVGAIGCTAEGVPVAVSRPEGAPLLRALERPDHAGFATPDDRALLERWVEAGASRTGAGLHGPSFADPRSTESHGAVLRARGYAPMLDPDRDDACGTCHDGAPRRAGITVAAAGASACTTCHTEPAGALACGTCHGSGTRAYPPRDRCFFPTAPEDRTHAAHAEPSAARASGLTCTTCHPTPAPGQIGGAHANGHVEVWFDYGLAGREARFDAAGARCAGTCHAHGGSRPAPAWSEGPVGCNDCHSSPPAGHYRGPCTTCHHEADATGAALTHPTLHLNGKVDLGDGSGGCGACHGSGDNPWPRTGAHRAHAAPGSARPVACETCHAVPANGERHPTAAETPTIKLGLLATRGGRRASYDPATKRCNGTYCHAGPGGSDMAPRWTDGPSASTCTSCHGAPPSPPHVQGVTTCVGAGCHEGSVVGTTMTPAGRLQHVDGLITRGL